METVKLEVQTRDAKMSPNELRRNKLIPAVFYGQGNDSVSVQMDYQTFRRAYMKVGTSQLIDLSFDGKAIKKVLVHEVQINPLSGEMDHVDFLLVNLKESITALVPVEVIGESPAVKTLGGILNVVKNEVSVKCLPTELPPNITVDISDLTELSSSVHVSDLNIPDGLEIMDGVDEVVLIINSPRVEEVVSEEETPAIDEGAGEAAAKGDESDKGEEESSSENSEA